jgi:hypothetical protein
MNDEVKELERRVRELTASVERYEQYKNELETDLHPRLCEAQQQLAAARAAAAEREDYGSKVARERIQDQCEFTRIRMPALNQWLDVGYRCIGPSDAERLRTQYAADLNAALAEGERRGALSMRNRAVQFVHDCGHKSTAYDLGHLPLSQD